MPQLSLYVTDANLALLRERSSRAGLSMSKYTNQLIERDAENCGWPVGFWSLYGAIDDDSFAAPPDFAPFDDEEFEAMFA